MRYYITSGEEGDLKTNCANLRSVQSHGVYHAMLVIAFLFAQLAISSHHSSDAHFTDDGIFIECDVCTVSADVFDEPSDTSSPILHSFEKTLSALLFIDNPREFHQRPGGARAPPQPQ